MTIQDEFASPMPVVPNISAEDVAVALRDELDLSDVRIAQVLYSTRGLDLTGDQVARALHAPNGLKLSAVEVALILRDGLGINADWVTQWVMDNMGETVQG